jgi:hypothetical protein
MSIQNKTSTDNTTDRLLGSYGNGTGSAAALLNEFQSLPDNQQAAVLKDLEGRGATAVLSVLDPTAALLDDSDTVAQNTSQSCYGNGTFCCREVMG